MDNKAYEAAVCQCPPLPCDAFQGRDAAEKWDRLAEQSRDDANIYREEEYIAGETIEHSSDEGLLPCDTCQLTVGRVMEIRQDEKCDGNDICADVLLREEVSCPHADENADDGHDVWVNIQRLVEEREHESARSGEVDVDVLLNVAWLESGFKEFREVAHCVSCVTTE